LLLAMMASVVIAPLSVSGSQSGRNAVEISGVVLAEGRNERIQNAQVRISDVGGRLVLQLTTSADGEFALHDVTPQVYVLWVEAAGFEAKELRIDLSMVSERGLTVYMKRVEGGTRLADGAMISAHELALPEAARKLVASGKAKLSAHKNAEALADFKQAAAAAPEYYEAYYQMSLAYIALGQTENAEAFLRKTIEVSHDNFGDANVGLGMMLVEKGDVKAGEKSLRRGVDLNPRSWMGFYELAKLDLDRNQLPDAQRSAEQARMLAPSAPIVYRMLANVHMRQKNYTALLVDIDTYIRLDPDSAAGVRAKSMRMEVERELAKHEMASEPKPH
jgi:tetratricopeptide (TPR) repeat protein